MKTGIMNLKIIALALVITGAVFLVCTTTPTGPDMGKYKIKISLVEEGNYEEDYTGTDLNMIVEFKDSIECSFDTIKIHSTDARFYLPDESITGQKVLSVVIPLYWTSTAKLQVDSSTMLPYDTVFVQVGLTKSNMVNVNILNLPPLIDSLIVGDTSYTVFSRIQDLNIFNFYIKDTLQNRDITLRVKARDLDSPGFNVSWENEGDDKYFVTNQSDDTRATYKARKGNFRDLVLLVVYDTDANVEAKVNIVQLDGSEIIVDSITYKDGINDTTFKDTSASHYYITSIAFNDSAAIRAFPLSTEGTALWSAVNGKIITNTAIDTNGFAITYVCTLSNISDTLTTDVISFVDSIRLVHKNEYEDDSLTKTIVLHKKPANKNPTIDSILINTDVRKGNYRDTIGAGSTIPLKAYGTDPEGGSVTYTWQGNLTGSLYSATGDSNSYTASATGYIDTIILIASDSLGFTDTQSIILSTNILPIIDSILIDTVMYKSGFQHVVNAESTITLKAFAHDPEAGVSGGTIIYRWQGILTGAISSTIENPITYTASSGIYSDTMYLVAADSLGFTDIQLLILPCNNPPIVDTLIADITEKVPVSPTDTIFTYSTSAPDSFAVRVVSHDMDSAMGDAVNSYLWRYKDKNFNNATSTSSSFSYVSADSAYVDTVSLTIKDKYNSENRQKIIITFTK